MNRPTHTSSADRQTGFTLVEILVALTLSVLLLAGTIQIFVSSKQAYRTQDALARLQESGRYATDLLATDIRKTGYTGCMPASDLATVENRLVSKTGYGWDPSQFIIGNDVPSPPPFPGSSSWSPALDPAITGVKPGTDVITIRYMAANGLDLVFPYSDSAQLFINPASIGQFNIGDILMVTDCSKGTLFQVTTVKLASSGKVNVVHSAAGTVSPGNDQPLFVNSYGEDAEVSVFKTEAFFIKDNASGIPSLYRMQLINSGGTAAFNVPEEMVEGIENMQILYGEDTDADGTANRYVPASSVTDMHNVVSVRISLLVQSISDFITTRPQSYTFPVIGGTATTPTDRRLRHSFTTTISLRNLLK